MPLPHSGAFSTPIYPPTPHIPPTGKALAFLGVKHTPLPVKHPSPPPFSIDKNMHSVLKCSFTFGVRAVSMNTLPRMIEPAALRHIAKANADREVLANNAGGDVLRAYLLDIQKQDSFLESFSKSFSTRLALRSSDSTAKDLNMWKRASAHFVSEYNATIESWHDEIYASAAARARGHLIKDEDTESGYMEDAEGNPIYHNADTKLTGMFLKAMYSQFDDKVDMNHKGGTTQTTRIVRVRGKPAAARPASDDIADAEVVVSTDG